MNIRTIHISHETEHNAARLTRVKREAHDYACANHVQVELMTYDGVTLEVYEPAGADDAWDARYDGDD